MSKTVEIKIDSFFGGVSDNPTGGNPSEFVITKHFDIFSDPKALKPYRALEADTNDGSTATGMKQYLVRDFVYASASAKLFGLGQTSGGNTKIVQKADATTGNWSTPANSEGNGAVKNGCFFEYKDYLWGFQGTNQVFRWGLLSGTPSITNSQTTVASTITSVANGVIAADGNAYMAYNNVIVRIAPDASTITDSAKIVPANYKITSLSNYGSYLAIGCSPTSSFKGESRVYIWNLSSDLFSDTIDWGEGDLRILEAVEGILIGISDQYLNNTVGAGRGAMLIRAYQGGSAQILKEVPTQTLNNKTIPTAKALSNNRLFFSAKIMTNTAGTEYNEGLWSFGRKNSKYPFALTLDINDESVNTSGIQGFGTAGNYFFIAHSNDGSISKTNDSAVFTNTSIYESQVIDFGDADNDKRLESVKVSFKKIASGETLTLKYKVNSASTWATIGTFSTTGALSKTFLSIESTGTAFASGREYEFRLESTGGLEITGIKAKATILTNP